ncbi:hypothetical protein RGR602_PC02297 (plasmid) [Rhizobium gallicum bv. gallicum R602sp]|uniref:Uncharacterized protein n=1 Tax=Rhizobium gallicum bv. gallicum R602sp TaxID=1041138 RepID=A0A0B4XGV7_9HYPH|nr:hypothetical protein RGR602_PC02297 [Rhizobium gallicum bv. gallicum R602sp]
MLCPHGGFTPHGSAMRGLPEPDSDPTAALQNRKDGSPFIIPVAATAQAIRQQNANITL